MTNLMPRHVEYIAKYSGLREQFVDLFDPSRQTEIPKFLLAVVDYKKFPTWDSCMSIYHLYLRAERGSDFYEPDVSPNLLTRTAALNLDAMVMREIAAKMKLRKTKSGRMGDPDIFDGAFAHAVGALNLQNDSPTYALVSQFLDKHRIDVWSAGASTRFKFPWAT